MPHSGGLGDVRRQVGRLLTQLYPQPNHNVDELSDRLVRLLDERQAERSRELHDLDSETAPDWFKSHEAVVAVLYADLFSPEAAAGEKLQALEDQLDYFEELGITVIHLLPIFPTSGDGGFAVKHYLGVDPRFGTVDALQKLIAECHRRGIRLALDFVLNHVSDEHPWAVAARQEWAVDAGDGDRHYSQFFLWSEAGAPWPGVPDVFPDFAAGHWDYVEQAHRWVWSTFYKRHPPRSDRDRFDFAQWDLNYRNPDVLLQMLDHVLSLANWGVDVFRLDAAPYLWKEWGTPCVSLPRVHTILKILRLGLQSVAPRAILLAEANLELGQLMEYFGEGDEVQTAYHFALMPALWQAVTIGQVGGIREVLGRVPRADDRAHWWVISEVHDELSFETVDSATARSLGRYFLDSGGLPFRQLANESFPRGISATTFTLLRGDLRRILLLWQLKLSLGWTPVFYLGEELGLENDLSYRQDPARRDDSRFVKRVSLTRATKERRYELGSKESYLFNHLRKLISWRKAHPGLVRPPDFFDTGSSSVLGFFKQGGPESIVVLANCSETQQTVTVHGPGTKTLRPFEFWWEARSIGG